ncbi:putative lipoprotein YmbA [Sphingopyxis sp. JAI108]|nr:putative lipoprotein YmbA [Sphingopyxis sp. JAI108]
MKRHLILLMGIQLAACGQGEPRSKQYFEANIEDARMVAAACANGSQTGAECANADVAIQTVEGRERFERFRGKR